MTDVLIADDQALVRVGLRKILENEPETTVVGELKNAVDASIVAFWRKGDINTRVAISYPCCVTCFQTAELVDAADHHHEPVRVH